MWLNNLLKKYNVCVHRLLIFIIVAKLFRKNCYKNTFTACLNIIHYCTIKQLFEFIRAKNIVLRLAVS